MVSTAAASLAIAILINDYIRIIYGSLKGWYEWER